MRVTASTTAPAASGKNVDAVIAISGLLAAVAVGAVGLGYATSPPTPPPPTAGETAAGIARDQAIADSGSAYTGPFVSARLPVKPPVAAYSPLPTIVLGPDQISSGITTDETPDSLTPQQIANAQDTAEGLVFQADQQLGILGFDL